MSVSETRVRSGFPSIATSTYFCLVPVIVAVSAALGWWLNVSALRNPFPNQPPVAPTTAVCLLALVISIISRVAPRKAMATARGGSFLCIIISGLVSLHYAAPQIWDLEQWLSWQSLPTAIGFAPGRMAPNTAVCLLILGVATLCRDSSRQALLLWHACVLAALAASLSFIIGFLYHVSAIYGVGAFTPIALPTALALFALACAELASRPDVGLIKLITGDGEGSYSVRRLLPAAIGIPVLLGFMHLIGVNAGWFDATMGVTLLVLLMVLSFSAIIIRNGILLNAITEERDRSLSTIRCLYGDLTQARDRAVQAVRVKSQFLANMSHEIRTPMNAVIGCADMLQRTTLNPDQKRFVDIIMSSGSTLVNIINDILELSKIEADKLELQLVPTNIVELLEGTAQLVAEKAQSKGVSLTTFVDPHLDRIVMGDPQRIRQVLLNIIGNSVKFTEKGSVTVTAQPVASTEEGLVIKIAVSDTGIGISKKHLDSLFQPFSQCDETVTRKYGGTGLGLAICRRLVELMQGTIHVASEENIGSTFTVTLPLPLADDSLPTLKRGDIEGVKLLVVGVPTNEFNVIKGYCDAWTIQADYAPDAQSALFFTDLAASADKPYSIVICEPVIGRGGTNAYSLRDLITERHGRVLHFVLLSVLDQVGKAEEAQERGFDAVLNKPIRQSDLFDTIVTLSASAPNTRYNKQRASSPRVDTFSSELPKDACRRILVVEDNPINQEVAAMQLTELGFDPHVCAGGQEALDYLENHRVALILMDCHMPGLDGFETTAAIRNREEQQRIATPIVAMTANAMEGDREICLEAGMNDYISKPVTADKLREVIERWFLVALESEETSSAQADKVDTLVLSDAVESPKSAPMDQLAALFGQAAAEKFLSMFLVQTPPLIEKIQVSLSKHDTERLREVAHELKGSCFAINCNQLAEICYEIERCAREGNIGGAAIANSKFEREFSRTAKDMEAWIHAGSETSMLSEKTDSIRVFLVEDNELTMMGISTILQKLEGLSVCGEAGDGLDAVQSIITVRPDVAVVDIGLPGLNGIEVTRRIKAIIPRTKVLILTSNDDDEDMFGAFAAGADGYVTKHSFDRHRLELAIRTVHSGACWLDPIIARRILSVASSASAPRAFPGAQTTDRATPLSDSERTLLHAVAADSSQCHLGVCQVDPSFLEKLQRFGSKPASTSKR